MSLLPSLIYFCLLSVFTCASDTPIIGILTQEKYLVEKYLPENDKSFIVASYVKFLESAGARVIPIWIGQDRDYYERVVNYTNGILFPGGGTYFTEDNGYGVAAKQIYHLAIKSNTKGTYYPIFGICLGMQVLFFADVGNDIRIQRSLKYIAVALNFTEGHETSRLFSNAPRQILQILKSKNVTHNLHGFSITVEKLKDLNILGKWRILATNVGEDDKEFISAVEHKDYPIYGVQFHPEKNIYEFKENVGIPHTVDAIKSAQYFANFFVDECRKNNNTFPSEKIEKESLIYNFHPLYTGIQDSLYMQLYGFTKDDYRNHLLL
ncbi:unnamed protein product [Phyllotreta striolata]|uniref:folate gamma-glutamyl hydrolase n=1 Tax=Phyllotreta striolata TaxID=444603 RepID=A0A9N9XQM8_PHYSR|nr:unnamed protein product [Phyllotreta striolata]